MNSFTIHATNDHNFKIMEGECRNKIHMIISETLQTFLSEEDFPVEIRGIPSDDKDRIGTLIITGENIEHIEVNYPESNKEGYSFRSALFVRYEGEDIARRILVNGKEFKAALCAPNNQIKFEIGGTFKTIEALSKKAQIKLLLLKMGHFFTLPTQYDADKLITMVTEILQIKPQEIDTLLIPNQLEIENGEIKEAITLGDGFCVFLSKEDGSVKYVSKGFTVEEYPDIQKYTMSYVKYDTFDITVLEKLHKEAMKQIIALRQIVANFSNK